MKYVIRLAAGLVVLFVIVYAGDYLSWRFRRGQTGSIPVKRFYAIPQKDGSTQFMPGDSAPEECVHALFPHIGDRPCWYVNRHTTQRINM